MAQTNVQQIKHGFYTPYYYWMFPLVVADSEGIFKDEGLEFKVKDIVEEGQPVDKANWYLQAFQEEVRNFYFCCTWQGVHSTCTSGKGKIVAAAPSTLIKTFEVYTTPDSGVNSIFDLARKQGRIAVNEHADSHYLTLENLRQFLPDEDIHLEHVGGVEKCLRALLDGDVEAASLAGPYTEFAGHVGLRSLMPLARDEPSLVVMEENVKEETKVKFLRAINRAIRRIRRDPEEYRDLYFEHFAMVVRDLFPEFASKLDGFKQKMTVPVWTDLRPLSPQEFEEVRDFMVETGLMIEDARYDELVETQPVKLAVEKQGGTPA